MCILLTVCLLVDADATIKVITMASLKIQLYWINWCTYRQARAMYDALVTTMTTPLFYDYDFSHGGKGWWEKLNRGWFEMYVYAPPMITPPPFTFVNLWERDQ